MFSIIKKCIVIKFQYNIWYIRKERLSMATQAIQKSAGENFVSLVNSDAVKKRFNEVLDKGAAAFTSSLIAIYNGNKYLQQCSPKSILGAAGLAATLKLSITPSLGHAYILPYKGSATFILGYKGAIQLAHRTGQYRCLHAGKVYDGEIRGRDPFTGEPIIGEKTSDEVSGYIAHFELINGFKKSLYMTVEEIKEHARNYSQSYGSSSSPWTKHFDAMATKTVLKKLLSTWGILSADMATAFQADQSVVDKNSFTYIDNGGDKVNREIIEVPFEAVEQEEPKTEFVDDSTGEIVQE